jgi:hypothetical protein
MAQKGNVGTFEISKRIERITLSSIFSARRLTDLCRKRSWFPPFANYAQNGAPFLFRNAN